jgi:hypothetical protein
VLGDLSGNPTKQVAISKNKETNITTITDITNLDNQIQYITPESEPIISIPTVLFYKP